MPSKKQSTFPAQDKSYLGLRNVFSAGTLEEMALLDSLNRLLV
ncbi:hypothetical protein [Desulfuribacillus stibiiarsenatis]|nr:hypothetical protein [Desulfuribacillus stibiiarsenatis]